MKPETEAARIETKKPQFPNITSKSKNSGKNGKKTLWLTQFSVFWFFQAPSLAR
jgi:hypothetical protein